MTTTYSVQGPDGQVHQFAGPDGATPQQVMAVAHQQFGGQPPAQAQPAASPEQRAEAAGFEANTHNNILSTAINTAADVALPFGLAHSFNAAVRGAGQRLIGVKHPDSASVNMAYAKGSEEGSEQANPVARYVGDGLGLILGGVPFGYLARGAGIAARAIPGGAKVADTVDAYTAGKVGQPVANFFRQAAVNGAAGGAASLAQGDSGPQALMNAGISGVTGPVVGKVTSGLFKALPAASQKAMLYMAKVFKEEPADLQAALDQHYNNTGQVGSLADIAKSSSLGHIKGLAAAKPIIGDAAQQAADKVPAPAVQAAGATGPAGMPQTLKGLTDHRDTKMDAAMTPIRSTPVPLTPQNTALFKDPVITRALKQNTKVLGNNGLQAKIDNDTLTLDDVDKIREALRNNQSTYANPLSNNHDRGLAKVFGDVANKVEGAGVHAAPQYGAALQDYKNNSQYIEGYKHGVGGKPVGSATGYTASSLDKTTGQSGYTHGLAQFKAQQSRNAVAPNSLTPEEKDLNPAHIAAAVASHGLLPKIGAFFSSIPYASIPVKAQHSIAKMLFDPAHARAGIAALRAGGARDKDISRFANAMGGAAALNVNRMLQTPRSSVFKMQTLY